MLILKQEINATLDAALDLVKWKLIVLATLTAAGVGVLKDVGEFTYGYLLLFSAPYVCLYIDLLVYERMARVHFLAKYLREYQGTDAECLELQGWERYVDRWRESKQWLPHENSARRASSLIASSCIPLLALCVDRYRMKISEHWWVAIVPAIGFVLVVRAQYRETAQDEALRKAGSPDQPDPKPKQVDAVPASAADSKPA